MQVSTKDQALIAAGLETVLGIELTEEDRCALAPVAEQVIRAVTMSTWREVEPEIVGGGGNHLSMMLVRRRHQLVYSVKLSNLLRDPIVSTQAFGVSVFSIYYASSLIDNLPLSFPGFLIGATYTFLRAFTHTVGYGEAALLHLMNQIQEEKSFVFHDDLKEAGKVLVENYGYIKGQNTNEINALLQSLVAWKAIEEDPDGYYVRESVPIGLGPLRYVDS